MISGPSSLCASSGIKLIQVESAQEMLDAVMQEMQAGSIFIGTAAVADYRVESPAPEKMKKKHHEELMLKLVKNPDILSRVADSARASCVVGFAAETTDLIRYATEKLQHKKLDMIVANPVGKGLGLKAKLIKPL